MKHVVEVKMVIPNQVLDEDMSLLLSARVAEVEVGPVLVEVVVVVDVLVQVIVASVLLVASERSEMEETRTLPCAKCPITRFTDILCLFGAYLRDTEEQVPWPSVCKGVPFGPP
jgi:hypothetical protein